MKSNSMKNKRLQLVSGVLKLKTFINENKQNFNSFHKFLNTTIDSPNEFNQIKKYFDSIKMKHKNDLEKSSVQSNKDKVKIDRIEKELNLALEKLHKIQNLKKITHKIRDQKSNNIDFEQIYCEELKTKNFYKGLLGEGK